MDWKKYEKEVFEFFKEQYQDADVDFNVKRTGLYSKVNRQIDILIEQYIAGNRMVYAVDCKYLNKKVDVKAVESYIAMLEDIGAHKGLLISKEGFSKAAYNRAHFSSTDIELDILNFEDLHAFQGHGAIPYAGSNGVLMPAPFGWVIDGTAAHPWAAALYRQGRTLEQAMKDHEFMYVEFWDRHKDDHNLSDLLKIQENNLIKADKDYSIEYIPTARRKDATTKLRVATVKSYPTPEYTGFVEFKDFIFFCVMFSPINRSKNNTRKLENIVKTVLPIKVTQSG